MSTGESGSSVIFQELNSPLLQPIHKKLDEANKEVILCVSDVTKEELPSIEIISEYDILSTIFKAPMLLLSMITRVSSVPGFEKVLLFVFEPARLLEI